MAQLKIYKIQWYIEAENRMKAILVTDKEVAEARYNQLKGSLYTGCWCSMEEMIETDKHELVLGDLLHYNDIEYGIDH